MATREIVQLRDKETGDINELRDKALKEAAKSSTPSDATNNSVIPLETENGETIKIKAESLMKAFATMINSNSKSTITTLFGALTASNNTEFGAINMSNLASVLGGLPFRKPLFTGDSMPYESGLYYVAGGNTWLGLREYSTVIKFTNGALNYAFPMLAFNSATGQGWYVSNQLSNGFVKIASW